MKCTLEFFLPRDDDDYKLAINGSKYWNALYDFSQEIRKNIKYNDELTEDQYKVWEYISDKFYQILDDEHVHLDEIQ